MLRVHVLNFDRTQSNLGNGRHKFATGRNATDNNHCATLRANLSAETFSENTSHAQWRFSMYPSACGLGHNVPERVDPLVFLKVSASHGRGTWRVMDKYFDQRRAVVEEDTQWEVLKRFSTLIQSLTRTYKIHVFSLRTRGWIYLKTAKQPGCHGSSESGEQSTKVSAALQSPVDIDDQPTCTAWSFRSIDAAHSVGGPSLSGVRQSGFHCLPNCVNWLWVTVSFGAY